MGYTNGLNLLGFHLQYRFVCEFWCNVIAIRIFSNQESKKEIQIIGWGHCIIVDWEFFQQGCNVPYVQMFFFHF